MKRHPLRATVALTAALTTVFSPSIASAQAAFEYKLTKPGLVVTGASSDQAGLQLSTTAINFGDVATNTTEKRQVLVSNPGTGALSFTAGPTVTGDTSFAAGATTCGATLAAGADCLAEATFSPTTAGSFNGVLALTTALAGSPHEVSLSGTAFNPVSLASATLPKAMLGVPYSYDFKQLLSVSNETSPDKSQATWSGNGTLPTGLSFNTGSGVLSGTPSVLNPGANYTVTGTYKNNQGQQVFTIKVGEAVLEVVQISAGGAHTCAVTTAGGLKCWGDDSTGQLGNDVALTNQSTPVNVSGLTSGVASVSAGNRHTCAVTTEGAVKCWGYNGSGRLGDGSTTQKATPIQVSGLSSGVKSISVGTDHTCAVTSTDAAQCWGANSNGQLGNETTVSSLVPVQVSGLTSGVADISAGYGHTCAVTLEGAAKCWGYNSSGQLGDGSTTQKATPVQVSGLSSGVKSISVGTDHTCAVSTAGAAKCWGSNGSGQVGNNRYDNSLYPAQVQGLSQGVTSVKAGAGRSCAMGVAGELKCWGENYNGGLGTGNVTNPLMYPLLVSKLPSGVAGVSMGHDFICVVTTSSAAKCWGRNYYGALGNGTTHSAVASTPTNVLP